MAEVAPLVIGLTGSIGMGKTETGRLFAKLGIPVHDSDAAVHALYEPGGAAVVPVGAAFPGAVKNGRVDRAALKVRLAGDPAALKQLESIVHPLVAAERKRFLADAARQGAKMAVVDVPLLFETGVQGDVDVVVVVSAPKAVQRARVLARPGMTEAAFALLAARQVSNGEKRAKADFVVETGQGLGHAFEQVKAIVATLEARRHGA